ncbi:hypothetical protein ACWDYA_13055 [Micrococcus luteus]
MTTTLNDKHTVMPPADLEEMLDLSRLLGGGLDAAGRPAET